MAAEGAARALRVGIDDYRSIVWLLRADGTLAARAFDSGALLEERRLFPGRTITAAAFSAGGTAVALGFADGSVTLGSIGFRTSFVDDAAAPPALRRLAGGRARGSRDGGRPAHLADPDPPAAARRRLRGALRRRIDGPGPAARPQRRRATPAATPTVHADGAFQIVRLARRENMLTGEVVTSRDADRPAEPAAARRAGARAGSCSRTAGTARCWPGADGHALRATLLRDAAPRRSSRRSTCSSEPGAHPDRRRPGCSGGPRSSSATPRGASGPGSRCPAHAGRPRRLLAARAPLRRAPAPGHRARPPPRARGCSSPASPTARCEVRHVTSHKLLARLTAAAGAAGRGARARAEGRRRRRARRREPRALELRRRGHPETTPARALPARLVRGGYPARSTSGSPPQRTDDFEPKLGLMPAGLRHAQGHRLLAALRRADRAAGRDLHQRVPAARGCGRGSSRSIELMASLPSVVLGFLAALVHRPLRRRAARRPSSPPSSSVPVVFLAGAYLWQLLPAPR